MPCAMPQILAHQKPVKQKLYKKGIFPLLEKENFTDDVNLSGPPHTDSNYTINYVF